LHNIFNAKLWFDHYGELEIVNHKTGKKCLLLFEKHKYHSQSEGKQVSGVVWNVKEAVWTLHGTWDKNIEAEHLAGEPFNRKKHIIWSVKFLPKEAKKYYNFS